MYIPREPNTVSLFPRGAFSDDPIKNADIRTGVIVGLTLGVALLALLIFLWYYRSGLGNLPLIGSSTIRRETWVLHSRRRRRRRGGRSKGSSKSSTTSASSASSKSEAAPAPAPASAATPAAAEEKPKE